jgi:hypothetical protein
MSNGLVDSPFHSYFVLELSGVLTPDVIAYKILVRVDGESEPVMLFARSSSSSMAQADNQSFQILRLRGIATISTPPVQAVTVSSVHKLSHNSWR